jgi:chaperonin GroEL (HSP60 family)
MVVMAIGSLLRSSLGPCGRDKLIIRETGEIVITNDGAKILRETKIHHPLVSLPNTFGFLTIIKGTIIS